MKSVFLDLDTLSPGDLDLGGLDRVMPGLDRFARTQPEQLHERTDGAEVVIVNKVVMDAGAIEGAGALKLIAIAATGTNNVDLEAARRAGVTVVNCRNYGTDSVAQHALTLILALTTRLREYQAAVREGAWQRSPDFCLMDYPVRELAGKTLGIVGYGTLGRRVAELGRALGMEVLVAERPGCREARDGRVLFEELLGRVDVLSLHCPLTDETRGLVDAGALARMKADALVINTARGGIVDEEALAAALKAGTLGGAGVDVLTKEPPRGGNPLLSADIPNLIVTPHSAWVAREARQRVVDQVAENVEAFLRGEKLRVVV